MYETLDYTAWADSQYLERAVFVRKLGWGRRRRVGRASRDGRLSNGTNSVWSDGSPVADRAAISHGQSPRLPETAVPREGLPRGRGAVADDMV